MHSRPQPLRSRSRKRNLRAGCGTCARPSCDRAPRYPTYPPKREQTATCRRRSPHPRSNARGALRPNRSARQPTERRPACDSRPSGTGSATSRHPSRVCRMRCNRSPCSREPSLRPRTSPTRSYPRAARPLRYPSRGSQPNPSLPKPPSKPYIYHPSRMLRPTAPQYPRPREYWDRGRPHPRPQATPCDRAPTGSSNRRYRNSSTNRRDAREYPPSGSSRAESDARGSYRDRESARGNRRSHRSAP